MKTKTIDAELIIGFSPDEDWTEKSIRKAVPGLMKLTAFLCDETIRPHNRLWVAIRKQFISADVAREFITWLIDYEPHREIPKNFTNEIRTARYLSTDTAWIKAKMSNPTQLFPDEIILQAELAKQCRYLAWLLKEDESKKAEYTKLVKKERSRKFYKVRQRD